MKRAAKRIAISLLVFGTLFISGKLAIHFLEREANIGLASGDLRQLGLAWRIYSDENGGKSPTSVQDLVDAEILDFNLFEYNGKPRCKALEFPKIVYKGPLTSDEPEKSTDLAVQRWSNTVELVLRANGDVMRQKVKSGRRGD